ncbi:protealysin inhibitor emfourin [Agromyces salentinus]|uniref:Uncharacterized protein n=1 Tax=Agromyces salentinus TaxID=269421 RepID=A0ABN2MZI6_9MICO|nr:protealysin inhibitor emfourin [Agromyces salentinus]
MDVFVSRSGGLAGLRLTWHVRVDDQPDADEWILLIEQIPWNEVPPAPPETDRFTWDIRCEPAPFETDVADAAVAPPAADVDAHPPAASASPAPTASSASPDDDGAAADDGGDDASEPRPQSGAGQHDDPLVEPQEATLAERQLTGPWRQLVDRVQTTTEPKREAPRAPRAR